MDTVPCPACGEENPSRFRLCGFCGTPLGTTDGGPVAAPQAPTPASPAPASISPAAVPAPAAAPTPAPLAARDVRKFVTLVFSDLKDSTALTGSIDGEAMNEIKARYFAAMAAEIERHGGRVEKYVGDAIMAVFGLLRAREDDALRAVQAAVGMQARLAGLNAELERGYGVVLTNRTGVNTGEIVANTDPNATQNLATGDAVNVAARLEQNAPADGILIGETTYALVEGRIEVEPLSLVLKGKTDPFPAYRVLGLRAGDGSVSQPNGGAFVAREAQTERLRSAFAEAESSGRPRLVVVTGDAGVGKTRLIADLLERLAVEATVLRGRCLPYGDGITFWPVLEIARAAARIEEADTPATARAKIRELLSADESDAAAIVDRVASTMGLAETNFPVAELFWGVRKLLEAIAADRPLVVVVDDVHAAEPTLLELLDHVVTAGAGSILVVCSARPELIEAQAAWAQQPHVEIVDLPPLDPGQVDSMIDLMLGDVRLPTAVRAKVVAAADGNPLYLSQIVSMLRQRGDAAAEITVPPTIQALLAARLDDLDGEERAVVEPASVIGLVFAQPAVEALVPDTLRPVVPTQLVGLGRKQFVHRVEGDDDAFRFHHVLVRDAAYNSLLKRTRASLHERFVEWAEPLNRARNRETEFEEILGYHLEQAVRYRAELGPLDQAGRALGERASAKLASAGRRAFARGDTPAAVTLLRRAVALLPADKAAGVELLTELIDALLALGSFEEAEAVVTEATAAADQLGDERLRERVIVGRRALELSIAGGSSISGALADLDRAIATFERHGDEASLARAWSLLMGVHGTAGSYDRMAEAAERVVEHARAAGNTRLATRGAVGFAVAALHGPTPVEEAIRTGEQLALDVRGDRNAEAIILGVLAQLNALTGAFEVARERGARARDMLVELGPSIAASSTSTESSRIEVLAGDLEAAELALRRDDAELEAMGERYFRASIDGMLAGVLVDRGRLEEAEAFAEAARTLGDPDDAEVQILWRAALGRILAIRNEPEAAIVHAQESARLAEATADLLLQADALADLSEVLYRVGRPEEALAARDAAAERYERKGIPVSVALRPAEPIAVTASPSRSRSPSSAGPP
ncbi:MAG: AAA family ATPase [Chloroflexota bacterium]